MRKQFIAGLALLVVFSLNNEALAQARGRQAQAPATFSQPVQNAVNNLQSAISSFGTAAAGVQANAAASAFTSVLGNDNTWVTELGEAMQKHSVLIGNVNKISEALKARGEKTTGEREAKRYATILKGMAALKNLPEVTSNFSIESNKLKDLKDDLKGREVAELNDADFAKVVAALPALLAGNELLTGFGQNTQSESRALQLIDDIVASIGAQNASNIVLASFEALKKMSNDSRTEAVALAGQIIDACGGKTGGR